MQLLIAVLSWEKRMVFAIFFLHITSINFIVTNLLPMPKQYDIHNIFHGTHLYAIGTPSKKTAYFYGSVHFRLSPFKLPDEVTALLPSIEQLITEVDYLNDALLRGYRSSGVDAWLRLYEAHPPLFAFAQRFFDHIRSYQEANETHFIYTNFPWLCLASEKEVVYTERLLYQLLPNMPKSGLETFGELRSLYGSEAKTIEQEIQNTLQMMLLLYKQGHLKQHDLAIYDPEADHSSISFNFEGLTKLQKVSERNKLWLKRIPKLLGSQTILFVVGVAHLITLLPSLMKMGYTLFRMGEDQAWQKVTKRNFLLPFVE